MLDNIDTSDDDDDNNTGPLILLTTILAFVEAILTFEFDFIITPVSPLTLYTPVDEPFIDDNDDAILTPLTPFIITLSLVDDNNAVEDELNLIGPDDDDIIIGELIPDVCNDMPVALLNLVSPNTDDTNNGPEFCDDDNVTPAAPDKSNDDDDDFILILPFDDDIPTPPTPLITAWPVVDVKVVVDDETIDEGPFDEINWTGPADNEFILTPFTPSINTLAFVAVNVESDVDDDNTTPVTPLIYVDDNELYVAVPPADCNVNEPDNVLIIEFPFDDDNENDVPAINDAVDWGDDNDIVPVDDPTLMLL